MTLDPAYVVSLIALVLSGASAVFTARQARAARDQLEAETEAFFFVRRMEGTDRWKISNTGRGLALNAQIDIRPRATQEKKTFQLGDIQPGFECEIYLVLPPTGDWLWSRGHRAEITWYSARGETRTWFKVLYI